MESVRAKSRSCSHAVLLAVIEGQSRPDIRPWKIDSVPLTDGQREMSESMGLLGGFPKNWGIVLLTLCLTCETYKKIFKEF